MKNRGLCLVTLPETNIFAPENGWLEYDYFPIGFRPIFRCKKAVSFREGNIFFIIHNSPSASVTNTVNICNGRCRDRLYPAAPKSKALFVYLDLPFVCVKCVPFHYKNLPKGRHFTYLEDPGMYFIYKKYNTFNEIASFPC